MARPRDLPTSLDLLRGFEAAARRLSFTQAAKELFVTQSAISRQVQALEEQLGVKLFHRLTRTLELTEAGEVYYREVSKALQQLRDATIALRAVTQPVVRVTTTVTFAALWLVPRLASFQARHEDISVHIAADNALRDLERSSLDIAVRYCVAETAGETALLLFGEQVAPICSPKLLGRRRRLKNVQELLSLPLLNYQDPLGAAPWLSWQVWLEAMQVPASRARGGLTFTHYEQVIQAALAGQGIALGRFPLVNDLIEEGRLILPLAGERYATAARNRAYWLIVSAAAQKRAEVQTFVRWIRAEVK